MENKVLNRTKWVDMLKNMSDNKDAREVTFDFIYKAPPFEPYGVSTGVTAVRIDLDLPNYTLHRIKMLKDSKMSALRHDCVKLVAVSSGVLRIPELGYTLRKNDKVKIYANVVHSFIADEYCEFYTKKTRPLTDGE